MQIYIVYQYAYKIIQIEDTSMKRWSEKYSINVLKRYLIPGKTMCFIWNICVYWCVRPSLSARLCWEGGEGEGVAEGGAAGGVQQLLAAQQVPQPHAAHHVQ